MEVTESKFYKLLLSVNGSSINKLFKLTAKTELERTSLWC